MSRKVVITILTLTSVGMGATWAITYHADVWQSIRSWNWGSVILLRDGWCTAIATHDLGTRVVFRRISWAETLERSSGSLRYGWLRSRDRFFGYVGFPL